MAGPLFLPFVLLSRPQEIDAFETIQRMLIALLDAGNNAGAKQMVSQIMEFFWRLEKL
jgi:hypothetical protein